jgi:hypothetical protein
VLRAPGYISLDGGLYKTFKLPWESHSLQFRWEVFNVTNTQRFDGLTISDLSLGSDPFLGGNPNSDFGRFTSTQTPLNETKAGRVMQSRCGISFKKIAETRVERAEDQSPARLFLFLILDF